MLGWYPEVCRFMRSHDRHALKGTSPRAPHITDITILTHALTHGVVKRGVLT